MRILTDTEKGAIQNFQIAQSIVHAIGMQSVPEHWVELIVKMDARRNTDGSVSIGSISVTSESKQP